MDPPSLGDPVFLIPSVFHWIFRALGAIFGSAAEKMGSPAKGPSFWAMPGPRPGHSSLSGSVSVFLESIFREVLEFSEGWEKWKDPRQMNFPLLLLISRVHPETHLGGFIAANTQMNIVHELESWQ